MNVTLTFNVFFGPLAIALLAGCGSMKNYEFSQIDQTIEREQYNLHRLQNNLAKIDKEQERLGEFLDYANSPVGELYHHNAQCRSPALALTASTPQSTEACAVPNNEAPIANIPDELVTAIAGVLCVAGHGKAPGWPRIPIPATRLLSGAMKIVRGLACVKTANKLKPTHVVKESCVSDNTYARNEKHNQWEHNEKLRKQMTELAARENKAELKRCESIVNKFPGLNRRTALHNWIALENRALEINSNIEKSQQAILDAL